MIRAKKATCRKCGRVAQYYGPVGGYSVQCEACNKRQSVKRRAAAALRRAKKAKPRAKKPRRVVLAVGHPWFSGSENVQYAKVGLTVGKQAVWRWIPLRFKDIGNWNKIRLVAEVLK